MQGAVAGTVFWQRASHPPAPAGDHRCPPSSPSAPTPRLQNPSPLPSAAFQNVCLQPQVPGDSWSCLGDRFGLPASPGCFHRQRTARVTWVDDREDHIAVSLLSFQPIQLLLLIALLPLILLLLSGILEGKAGKNWVGKATGTGRGANGARLAPFSRRGQALLFGEQSEPSYLDGGNLKDLVHVLQGQRHIPQRRLVRHLLCPWRGGGQRVTVLTPAALHLPPALPQSRACHTPAMLPAAGSPLPCQRLLGFGLEQM